MKISSIYPEKEITWQGAMAVEIDVDWAHEEIIEDTVLLLEKYGVDATFFATHKSLVIDNILNSNSYEIGIHPNFIPLLRGDTSKGKDFKEVIDNLMNIYPDSKSSKAHSLVDSSVLLDYYNKIGITHDNTYLIDAPKMLPLVPWRLWNNLIRVPLFWEDDYATVTKYQCNFNDLIKPMPGLRVFGFHPLHIFLNTESLERYEATRNIQDHPKKLLEYRYDGEGTRTRFIQLLNAISSIDD